MTDRRARTGKRGEELARRHLEGLGYLIEDQNWSCRVGELDLVVSKGDVIVFVEVRSARAGFVRRPMDSVLPPKQLRVARAADIWLQAHGRDPDRVRFDVVGVCFRTLRRPLVDHVEDAFTPPWGY